MMNETMTWWNAKIKKTYLGYEDHGMLTFFITVEGDGKGQHIGNYSFGGNGKYHEYGLEMIAEILRVVGVESWEELPGKYLRVKSSNCKVYCIQNIVDNTKWFDFVEYMKHKFPDVQ